MNRTQSAPEVSESISIDYLVESLESRVREMASRRTRCPGLRDDACQSGLIAVVRAAGQFNPDLGVPLENYALASAKNAVINCVKRTPIKEKSGFDLPERATMDENEGSLVEALRDWIERLPHQLCVIFHGLYVRGLSQRQLASVLGVSQPRVSALNTELIARGRLALASATIN